MALNDDISDRIISDTVNLLRFSAGAQRRVLAYLEVLRVDLKRKLEDYDLGGMDPNRPKYKRADTLLKQVNKTIKTRMLQASKQLKSELIDLAPVMADATVQAINGAFQTEIASVQLTPAFLRAVSSDVMIQGGPAKAWWSKQSTDLQSSFAQQIRLGMGAGESNAQIVKRIIGGRTGTKVVEVEGKKQLIPTFSGGIMDTSRRNAETLVRTATATTTAAMRQEVYAQNQDVLRGQQLIVTLDNRTTPICRARSGGAWDFDGNPLPESAVQTKFPGSPPYHYNCRSILVPITKSWEQLAEEGGASKEVVKALKGVGEAKFTQSSMDGQVAGDLTYEGWLKTKPASFQREVLGDGRYELWKKDKLSLSEMVDQSGNELTLEELRAKANGD